MGRLRVGLYRPLHLTPLNQNDEELMKARGSETGADRRRINPLQHDGSGRPIDWGYLALRAPPEEVDQYLWTFDSYARTGAMAWLMLVTSAERAMQLFLNWHNVCDAPWPWRSRLANAMRRAPPARHHLRGLADSRNTRARRHPCISLRTRRSDARSRRRISDRPK